MHTIDEILAATPSFTGLRPEHLEVIAGCAQNVAFDAGALILREGGPADTFFVLRRGRVELEIAVPGGGQLVIETLGPGDTLGWSWLFEPYRWHFDARATEPVGAIAFDAACLRGKCENDHDLGYELMRRFANNLMRRLQSTRVQLLDVYGHLHRA